MSLRPFTFAELESNFGRRIIRKEVGGDLNESHQFDLTDIRVTSSGDIMANEITVEHLMEHYHFINGNPCGVVE